MTAFHRVSEFMAQPSIRAEELGDQILHPLLAVVELRRPIPRATRLWLLACA